jgi:GNAT superfamily N-acetyltransferase
MVRFEKATEADAEKLMEVQVSAFLSQIPDDKREIGGPPGYDSVEWQVHTMHQVPYIKILTDDQIIGGIVLRPMGADHYHVERIFLHPAYHRRGIGTQAFAWLETTYPQVRVWTLRSPALFTWNQRFYEKLDYRRTGEMEVFPGFVLIEYEKRIGEAK